MRNAEREWAAQRKGLRVQVKVKCPYARFKHWLVAEIKWFLNSP